MTLKKQLNIGVFGAGHLGKIHLRLLNESKRYNLVGFYDPDEKAAKSLAEANGYVYFDKQEDLIAASEVIDIVTPTRHHHEIARSVLHKGSIFLLKNPLRVQLRRLKNWFNWQIIRE